MSRNLELGKKSYLNVRNNANAKNWHFYISGLTLKLTHTIAYFLYHNNNLSAVPMLLPV